jgi:hypothetical protein
MQDRSRSVSASRLSLDQFLGNGLDLRRTGKLLEEMKRQTKPVEPKLLGAIGFTHFGAHIITTGGNKESIEYKTAAFSHDGIPYLVEAAFGYRPKGREEHGRAIITGVNNSVAIGDPFRDISSFDGYEQSLGELLTELKAGQEEPIVFVLHLVCPRVDYLDRGKSAVSLPLIARREIVRLYRRADAMLRREHVSQKEAAAQVLEAAYMKASNNGELPANARQIYYAARPAMLELTGLEVINYNYFSQTLLIDFMADNEELCADWDVVFDDRGHFEEPHNGGVIGLGTLSVRSYLKGNHAPKINGAGFKDVTIDTHGADGRFGALFFIEKEGFRDLFKSVNLSERYDIAIMSSKGVSVTAARKLADHLCHEHDIPLLTLHDFDVAGFTIGRIGRDTRRYTFENDIKDLDALAEPCRVEGDKREELENSGATDDEIDFLLGEGDFEENGPRRIELNALTSRQLVDLVERRLEQHGIKKIVPAADKLAGAFRAHARAPKIKEAIEKAIADMPDDAVEVPADLEEQVKAYLEENPECPWEEAVAEIVRSGETD